MVKAIIFDFFGVIRRDEYHNWLESHGLKRGGKLDNLSKDMDKGITTVDEFFEELSRFSGIAATKIKQEFLEGSIDKRLVNLIINLKEHYKIGLLSNASSIYIRTILRKTGIADLFDQIIISSEIGYIKPSNKIFDLAINKLEVRPSEAIFIDDNASFCKAAEALGIKSINFVSYKELIINLKEMGIMVE
ncbi:MAG: HAD family hydrolase [Candidatus Saccharimonadales bacterium]